jgi:RHH-type proline utilization regulon transcriptional repressor/proline dehydrogenase/delta 1-pyrroline-5-carboxylate dehydrogenase
MDTRTVNQIEARTQELGRALYDLSEAHRPSLNERVQDRLMVLLMKDHKLRTRLLRFVDVLAALPRDPSGRRTAALFREYFDADFETLPWLLRPVLGAARSPLLPDLLVRKYARFWTRLIASRFIVPRKPGAIEDVLDSLQDGPRYPSFDLLGEEVVSEVEAEQYRRNYLDLLAELGRLPAAAQRTQGGASALQVSIKLSSLTSQFNPTDPDGTLARVRPALEEICDAARSLGIGVTVDAEQYAAREAVWRIVRETFGPQGAFREWPDGGMVVQAYLRDAEAHAREVIAFARARRAPFSVRLVKGAYWDYEVIVAEQKDWPVPVHRNKGATDAGFEGLVRLFLEEAARLVRLAVGSHNVRSHAYAEAVREAAGLPEGAVEHQTLFRTLEGLSRALAQMGWPERDYIPVGDLIPGMAYLVRRILENTSQIGFLGISRTNDDVAELLAPPAPGEDAPSYARPRHETGFVNGPPARFFDAAERERFQEALARTRAQWGRECLLEIGGEPLPTAEQHKSLSPSNPNPSRPVGVVHLAGIEETERAIALANAAQPAWAARPIEERAAIGLRAAAVLRERKYELAAWVVHEGAKDWHGAMADVDEAIDHVEWNARQLQRLAPLIKERYVPMGVVACIPPWNFPIALPAVSTSAALLAGNAVILKSSERTPIIAQMLVAALHDAGVPRDVLIHLPGRGAVAGARLVESSDVDMVAFTGSKAVGVQTYKTASAVAPRKGSVKRVVAEMGGKNAIVVFPEADMDEAVHAILASAFGHAGQKCSACSRVLIHEEVYERLRDRLVEAARGLPVGPADDPGTVINPVIDARARESIQKYAQIARQEGRVLLDLLEADSADGPCCLGPMIVEIGAQEAHTARIAQEEVFGPVLTLIPFTSEEEAVELVNATPYALTLGVFSRSPKTVQRMVKACQAGNIYVNRDTTGARVGIEPFGGFKLSGTGPKAGGEDYLLAFLTRREGFPTHPLPLEGEGQGEGETLESRRPRAVTSQPSVMAFRPWSDTPIEGRLERLHAVVRTLQESAPEVAQAIALWKGVSPAEAEAAAAAVADSIQNILDAASEIARPQKTVEVPGQETFTAWDTPRGVGLVAVDDGSDPSMLANLIAGPLAAGNGVVVATTVRQRPFAEKMIAALHQAGVPEDVVALAGERERLEALAASPIRFAAVDLDLAQTQSLYRVLGVTREDEGERGLKALISMAHGPRPGEPGFLQQFAHPKTVAIRTLRHGAELELL